MSNDEITKTYRCVPGKTLFQFTIGRFFIMVATKSKTELISNPSPAKDKE